MTVLVTKLSGVTPQIHAELKRRSINDSEQLLDATLTPQSRQALATAASVEVSAILALANRADLARINGIGGKFSDLLEKAGVDTVSELANRTPTNLLAKLKEVNDAEQITRRLPTLAMVQNWVSQAKGLPKVLEY